ncbi:serine hydrolase domain-containing protein [Zobellia nedashkovskayae]
MKIIQLLILLFAIQLTQAQEGTAIPLNIEVSDALVYGNPFEVGLDSVYINTNIKNIITNGIKNNAFPGAQVLVAKNGKIIFHKVYGYHTYDSIQPVALDDIYDLASVTKVTAALPAIMKLVDEGKLDLDVPFSTYWKRWKNKKR